MNQSFPVKTRVDPAGAQVDFWTTEQSGGQPLRYWRDIVCRELVELEIEAPSAGDFKASMLRRRLGSIEFNLISAHRQQAFRTAESIRRTREPRFDLVHVRAGTLQVNHYGRSVDVNAGECVLIDSANIYEFTTSDLVHSASLQIPQKWLRNWIPVPEDGVARIVTAQTPWGNALLATLDALTAESLRSLPIPGEVLAEQIAGLLALALGNSRRPHTDGQGKLLPLIMESLRELAHDEDVCPQTIADVRGISKRYLHRILASAGTTFNRELLEIRLERASRLLTDPRFRDLGVSEIGWRCGFVDSSHFARRFHLKFGITPSEYRRGLPSGT